MPRSPPAAALVRPVPNRPLAGPGFLPSESVIRAFPAPTSRSTFAALPGPPTERGPMNPIFDRLRLSRWASLALFCLLALAALGLSQCRLLDHSPTGLALAPQSFDGRNACMHRCDDQYKGARSAEEK